MKRRACLRVLAGLLVSVDLACQRYENEAEELAHLNALSNPTLEQFRRRKELTAKAAKVLADRNAAWDKQNRLDAAIHDEAVQRAEIARREEERERIWNNTPPAERSRLPAEIRKGRVP